jgi:polyhydroxyalkanoate synthesis regulator phasin
MFDAQKMAFEKWTDWMEKFSPTAGKNHQEKAGEVLLDFFKEQKNLFEKAFQTAINPQKAAEAAPEFFKQWLNMQTDFGQRWAKSMGAPGFQPDFADAAKAWQQASSQAEKNMRQWEGWASSGTDWLKNNILEKLPDHMRPHFSNFTDAYSLLYDSWERLSKMMENGLYDPEIVRIYFSAKSQKNLIDKLMGFSLTDDPQALIERANQYFQTMSDAMGKGQANAQKFARDWQSAFEKSKTEGPAPFIDLAYSLNEAFRREFMPLPGTELAGGEKAGKLAKMLQDIQFSYAGYVLRTSEMQARAYQAAQPALPETLQAFHEEFSKTGDLPSFEEFFKKYIDILEKHFDGVLSGEEFSRLQTEAAKAGVTVKSKISDLMELAADDAPFLKRSEGDDFARELAALHQKIRDLENQLAGQGKNEDTKKPAANKK